jgi:hypothetical protein
MWGVIYILAHFTDSDPENRGSILQHVDPLLGNDREISNYKTVRNSTTKEVFKCFYVMMAS